MIKTAAGGTIVDGRTLCAVVGCKRSKKGEWSWWICTEHWRMVPMWAKRRQTRVKRAMRRRGWLREDKGSWTTLNHRAHRIADRIGGFLIDAANHRAAGI